MVPLHSFALGMSIGGVLGIAGTAMVFLLSDGGGDSAPAAAVAVEARAPKLPDAGASSGGRGTESRTGLLRLDPADPRLSFRQLHRAAEEMALENPVEAIRAGMRIPGTDNREAFLSSVFRTWGGTAGESAAAWTSANLAGERMSDALYHVADGWAEADPQGAAEWFGKHTDGVILDDATWEILETWGRKDPRTAWQWAQTLDPYVKQTAMSGLAEGWAAVDPEGARDAGMAMLAAGEGHAYEFLVAVAGQWGGSNPRTAAGWAAGLANERLREGILEEVAATWSQTDPEGAAMWADGLEDAGSRRFAQAGIAAGWPEHAPGGAVEWALDLADDQRREIVREIVGNWARIDPRDAVRWLEARPAGAGRDAVLEAFSDAIFADAPEVAVEWAGEIGDSTRRRAHVEKLTELWIQEEGAAAIDVLRRMNLPAGAGGAR